MCAQRDIINFKRDQLHHIVHKEELFPEIYLSLFLSETPIKMMESARNSQTNARKFASPFLDAVVDVILQVTLRIIYVIHSVNIGAPCRKASA